jgi:WD40 repeat protein
MSLKRGSLSVLQTLAGHQGVVQSLDCFKDDKVLLLLSCDSEGVLMTWEVLHEGSVRPHKKLELKPETFTLSPNAPRIVSRRPGHAQCAVAMGDEIFLVDLSVMDARGKVRCRFPVSAALWTSSGRFLVVAGRNSCVIFDSAAEYAMVKSRASFSDKIYCGALVLSQEAQAGEIEGVHVALGSYQKVFLWTPSSDTVTEFAAHEGIVSCIAPYKDGIVSAGYDGLVKLLGMKRDARIPCSFEDEIDVVLNSIIA